MIYFNTDFVNGMHPLILKKLEETNEEQLPNYGTDFHTHNAQELIKKACNCDCDVHLLVGGTQANVTILSHMLRPYQGVITAATGHINVHETGALEATGHKNLVIPSVDGKISAKAVEDYYTSHFGMADPSHEIQPKAVYISNSTELGTIYTKKELKELSAICKKLNLYFMMDGARLGYALGCKNNDVTLEDLAQLLDVFYLGGTKLGAMFGEAVVITNSEIKEFFRYSIKQNGGMLAKGRFLGIQFEVLMQDELYLKLGKHAAYQSEKLQDLFKELNISTLFPSPSNQQFPIFPNSVLGELEKKYVFEKTRVIDDAHTCVRICTSWATKDEDLDMLINDIKSLY